MNKLFLLITALVLSACVDLGDYQPNTYSGYGYSNSGYGPNNSGFVYNNQTGAFYSSHYRKNSRGEAYVNRGGNWQRDRSLD